MATPKSLAQLAAQARQMLLGMGPVQTALVAGGVLLLGVTVWAFVGLMNKPKMSTLYSGLKPGEAQALGGRLAAKNIVYELSPDATTLLVSASQLDAARLETAAQGLPRTARMGFELFDTPNWMGSDFSEKVNYQRALEGELERTLQTLSDVESVRVHLVMPHDSLFVEQESQAKAAVILKTRGGALSEQEQRAIPQLVASAVEGLRPENVTVVDADDNAPLVHSRTGAAGGGDLEESLNQALLRTLEPVVGPGHVRASVHVEYDLSTSENTEEVYDPKATATLTEQKSQENAGGASPAGVPGTASNVPGGTAAGANSSASTASDTQSSHSESVTYAVSKSVKHTMQPAGAVKRIAAAVLIDDAQDAPADAKKPAVRRKRTTEEMKELEQLAGAAIGLNPQRGDTLALENLSFETPPVLTSNPPTKLEVTRRLAMQWSWALRYLGIAALFLIVYLLILRPVKKQILTTFSQLPAKLGEQAKALAKSEAGAIGTSVELLPAIEQARHAATLKKQLAEKIKTEPAAASRLVQSWIREEPGA